MKDKKWGLWFFNSLCSWENMVGGGVFMLPSKFSKTRSSPIGSTLARIATRSWLFKIALVSSGT